MSTHVASGPHLATPEEAERYVAEGWWSTEGLVAVLDRHASERPDGTAWIGDGFACTWAQVRTASTVVASVLQAHGVSRGTRVAVLLADSPIVHAVYLGVERAGAVVVGIGPRAGRREVEHILSVTAAELLIAPLRFRDHDLGAFVGELSAALPLRELIELDGDGLVATLDGRSLFAPDALPVVDPAVRRRPDELFLLNSTSGTTGLPKVVMHTANRWRAFHRMAAEAGELTAADVFMSVIPAPYGFGIWTAHVTPLLLGAPCVVLERFTAEAMLEAIERHRVTVLAAVSTQFIMALNAESLGSHQLSTLRALFTGGEAVPYERAARFEEVTGARVLQFFGSNETGALSVTTTRDTPEQRLRTAGRVIPVMNVRLFADDGRDITDTGGPGRPACRGPVTCLGYLGDPAATEELVRPDGWMLTGDIVVVDADGYLSVVGRTSDFVIRGGKNISAPAVEEAVGGAPGVAMVAAVAAPSPVFGERVCVYVVPAPGATVTLSGINDHLAASDVSKEAWPELLVLVDALPMSSGGKVAKGDLRADVRRRIEAGELNG
ncbi:MAG TPA: class I adenylate-forming enzyme family protein [Ilumatobacter sp.]|nr:class I adenylate-forming enzyme family protein [Ilumatobacter sp.]